MKQAVFILFLVVVSGSYVCGQNADKVLSGDAVPPVVIKAFKNKFPEQQKATWFYPVGNIYKVMFYQNEKLTGASFDNAGKFTGYMAYGKKESLDSLFRKELKVMMH